MNVEAIDAILDWLVGQGLGGGQTEMALLQEFCARCQAAGIAISRALTIIDTLHPIYEGRAFRWSDDGDEDLPIAEYGRTNEGEAAENWRRSIFYHMLETDLDEYVHDLHGANPLGFTQLDHVRDLGNRHLLALLHRFATEGVIGEMDCVYSYWCTRAETGFSPDQLAALRRLVPALALAIKCAALARIAKTLVEVYLGRDAGRRVLEGRILRGVAERINAVLWFSDLRGYTRITDSSPPEEIIPLLNDYADAVISAIQDNGGDVLKLIGDGVLAIFTADSAEQACHCALTAEASLRERLVPLKMARRNAGRPVTTVYLGLHIGEVSYGNVGSNDRLDFTVVGPAVNEVNRIASMCRSADRNVLLSADFVAAAASRDRRRCVSVGRYAFRGVQRPRELYTLEDAGSGD